jgi:hypothetical protein
MRDGHPRIFPSRYRDESYTPCPLSIGSSWAVTQRSSGFIIHFTVCSFTVLFGDTIYFSTPNFLPALATKESAERPRQSRHSKLVDDAPSIVQQPYLPRDLPCHARRSLLAFDESPPHPVLQTVRSEAVISELCQVHVDSYAVATHSDVMG